MPDVLHRLDGPDARALVIIVPHALTHENADDLRACAERWLPNRDDACAILDLANVNIISTIGIAAMLQIDDLCTRRGARFALANVPPRQLNLLKMLHLAQKFRILPTVEEAIASA